MRFFSKNGVPPSVITNTLVNSATETKTEANIEIKNELATKRNPFLRKCFSKSVEPLVLCWMVPFVIASIAIKNLQLEKACRVNFDNKADTCSSMIHRSESSVVCHGFSFPPSDSRPSNTTTTTTTTATPTTTTAAATPTTTTAAPTTTRYRPYQQSGDYGYNSRYKRDTSNASNTYDYQICTAEYESQRLSVQINTYVAPIDSSVALSVIIYVVGFFGRRGFRKTLMLLPMLGDLAALIVYLIAAIFFDQLPTQFNAIIGKLCSSFGGKENLMLMALYSYLADTTPKLERLYRFAVFGAFLQIIPTIFKPLSAILFRELGYIKLFMLCIAINLIGILYLLFWLKDVEIFDPALKKKNEIEVGSADENDGSSGHEEEEEEGEPEATCSKELMKPSTVIESIRLVFRKRKHNKRRVVMLFVVLYFIVQIPIFGETDLLYDYTRNKLDWGSMEFCSFSSVCNFSAAVGIIILIGIGARLLGVADAALGFISSAFSVLARFIFTTASKPIIFYAGVVADMFVDVRVLVLKNIITLTVESNEIRKAFCLIAILDVLSKCVSVPSYSKIYEMTINRQPEYLYAPSLLIYILASVLFCILYFVIRKQVRDENAEELKKAEENEEKANKTAEHTKNQSSDEKLKEILDKITDTFV